MGLEENRQTPGLEPLLIQLLKAQEEPTLVEQLVRHQEQVSFGSEGVYRASVEALDSLGPGKQLAFRVDLDECTGCKACVTACHNLNGLAPEETWRDVGSLVAVGPHESVQQTITTACHHCEEPACLKGCPVQAYEKDDWTGIVRHLDDQCIGCSYCILKCPYDVPKYHEEMGIVRKCDMCAGRLKAGEAPACVQGCPNEAIAIQIVAVGSSGEPKSLLPGGGVGVPPSDYTRPTTTYVTKRELPVLQPRDRNDVRPSEAHDPLALMLVFTQVSIGGMLFGMVALGESIPLVMYHLLVSGVMGGLGLMAATFHLGRPMYAYRAFLGWRTSWLSREILLFGVYVPSIWLTLGAYIFGYGETLGLGVYLGTVCMGVLGWWCSVMIYVDTQRPLWAMKRTVQRFASTALGTGAMVHGLGRLIWLNDVWGLFFVGLGWAILAAKLTNERSFLQRFSGEKEDYDGTNEALLRTARLLRGPLNGRLNLRMRAGVTGMTMGMVAGVLMVAGVSWGAGLMIVALLFILGGECLERHLYFTSEANFRMPGS